MKPKMKRSITATQKIIEEKAKLCPKLKIVKIGKIRKDKAKNNTDVTSDAELDTFLTVNRQNIKLADIAKSTLTPTNDLSECSRIPALAKTKFHNKLKNKFVVIIFLNRFGSLLVLHFSFLDKRSISLINPAKINERGIPTKIIQS